jgi:hypothetical protein
MIKHTLQKKRVIVMDCDVDLDGDHWKSIMRHVLGRHYTDLQGNGPGWSFSHNHLDTFLEKIENTEKNTCSSTQTETKQEIIQEKNVCSSTQTEENEKQQNVCSSTQTENNVPHSYKYDIDDSVRFFVDKWIQQYNFVLKN